MENIIDTVQDEAAFVTEVKVAPSVYADAKPFDTAVTEIPDAIKAVAAKVDIAISTAEELAITKLEASFAQTQLEIAKLTEKLQSTQKEFNKNLQEMATKYAIDPSKHLFDISSKVWKAL